MANPYKLNTEIEQFIIQQKRADPKLSCRRLVSLIRELFQVNLSKSLINNVIKQNNLSSPIGRRGEIQIIKKEEAGTIENGGCFFLKAADLKLSLSSKLSQNLSGHFPHLSSQNLKKIIETSIYSPIFKHKDSLWFFIGEKVASESLEQYWQQLSQISLQDLSQSLMEPGFNHNINEINEINKFCLTKLNSYVQTNFFPPVYQILDWQAMFERFYCLSARVEKKTRLLKIEFVYPLGFSWVNDIVWQEDLFYAVNNLNKAEIFTLETEQLWINPRPHF